MLSSLNRYSIYSNFSHFPFLFFLRCFHSMVNYILPPSSLGVSNYSLFKTGIKPVWDDPALAGGGRWNAKLPFKLSLLDELWLHLNMAMIGKTQRKRAVRHQRFYWTTTVSYTRGQWFPVIMETRIIII